MASIKIFKDMVKSQGFSSDGESFAIFSGPLSLNYSFPQMVPDLMVCILCRVGGANISYGPKRYAIKSGSLFICLDKIPMKTLVLSPDFEGDIVLLSRAFFVRIFGAYDVLSEYFFQLNPLLKLTPDEVVDLSSFFQFCARAVTLGKHPVLAIQYLTKAMRFYKGDFINNKLRLSRKFSKPRELTSAFIALVDKDCAYQKTVADYAKELCVSYKYLTNSIKSVTGMTALTWIELIITYRAQVLLADPRYTIEMVTKKLGFDEKRLFIRFFKTNSGVFPQEYMESARD